MNAVVLSRCLAEFRKIWKNFPVQHMLVFLEIARNDIENRGWGVLDIADRLEIPQATASRTIMDMSSRNVPPGGAEPIDLVESRPHPTDHRRRIPGLTARGRIVHDKLVLLLGDAAA